MFKYFSKNNNSEVPHFCFWCISSLLCTICICKSCDYWIIWKQKEIETFKCKSQKSKNFTKKCFEIRGHSTTRWTRRGGGGVSKKSTQGGGLNVHVHVDKIEEKNHLMVELKLHFIKLHWTDLNFKTWSVRKFTHVLC